MSGFLEGQTKRKDLPVKRFGYILSALFVIASNVSLYNNWMLTPWLFLVTMYLLTGSLWAPALIRPFYKLFGKYLVPAAEEHEKADDDSNHQ